MDPILACFDNINQFYLSDLLIKCTKDQWVLCGRVVRADRTKLTLATVC